MRKMFLSVIAALVVVTPLAAHHSYGGYGKETIDVEGVLEQFDWVNPHAFLKIRGANNFLYIGEWAAVRRLAQYGITQDTLKIGDRIVITGLPRLDLETSGLITIRGLRRPADGWSWLPNTGVQTAAR